MATFDSELSGPQGSAVQAQGGIVDTTTAQTISGVASTLGGLFGGSGGIGQALAQAAKDRKQKQADDVLTQYAQFLNKQNAAVEQGKSWDKAKMETRARFQQLTSNFPSLTEDLIKLQGNFNSLAGFGDVLAKGTAVDQQLEADKKSAVAAGFVSPDMSQEQQAAGLARYKDMEHNKVILDYNTKQIQYQNAQLETISKRQSIANQALEAQQRKIDLQLKRNKVNIQNSLSDVAVNYTGQVRGRLEQLQQFVDGGGDRVEAMKQLNAIKNEIYTQLQPVRGAAGADYVDGLAKPMLAMIDNQADLINGKIEKDVYANQLDKLTTLSALPIMKNEKMAAAMAISKMVPALSDSILAQVAPEFVNYLNKNLAGKTPANLTDDEPDAKAQTKVYLKGLGDLSNRLESKDPSIRNNKEVQQELEVHMNQVLKGVNAFSLSVENPAQLNNLANFFASDGFKSYAKSGKAFNRESADAAQSVMNQQYADVVIPAIQKEIERTKTVVGYPTQVKQVGAITMPVPNDTNTTAAVQHKFVGKGVLFSPAPGMENNRGAVAKAKELNAKVAPLINRLVRMSAHLQQSDDYQKFYDQYETAIFGAPEKETK